MCPLRAGMPVPRGRAGPVLLAGVNCACTPPPRVCPPHPPTPRFKCIEVTRREGQRARGSAGAGAGAGRGAGGRRAAAALPLRPHIGMQAVAAPPGRPKKVSPGDGGKKPTLYLVRGQTGEVTENEGGDVGGYQQASFGEGK